MKYGKGQNRNILPHILLSLWSLVVLFPVWTMVINSLKMKLDIYKNPFWLPPKWNFQSYLTVLKNSDFILYFRNSLSVTIGSILLILFFGSLAAYALVNWKSRISRWAYAFLIAGMMFPIRIGSINLLQIINSLGLLNTVWSLYPVYIAMGMPIAVFVLSEFIRQIPDDLTEAATIDGAGRFRIYRSILVPLLRPALGTVAIFNLVPFWNDLWFPLLFITKEEHKTLILGVTRLFGQYQTDWSRILAVLTLSAVPVMALYLMMSKQFIEGLTAGAVKG
jgi:raffinose/stachyose/melibiose transport system permease protein